MTPKQKKEAVFYILLIILASISLFFKNKTTDQPIEALIQTINQSLADSGDAAEAGDEAEAKPASDSASKTKHSDIVYTFRNRSLLQEHYEKHGQEMGFDSAASYEQAASAVVNNPDALHKLEAEDGDDVYFLETTGELVIVSTDGYIRTYFKPHNGKTYFNRQ